VKLVQLRLDLERAPREHASAAVKAAVVKEVEPVKEAAAVVVALAVLGEHALRAPELTRQR
jgi:hypothetical protein